ncbi:ATP-binding protein [Mycolicibacterium septicum]|uniref:ATP-binding protein n=1 Tax=Mycolicibacterium septicum TaxID=98668 RepID=UPI00235EF886|nr:ATP-binding protein [Mycolicibacterium septicum]
MTDTAQVFTGVHDTPVYTNVVFNKPLRIWVAIPAVIGTVSTALLTVLNLASGHALAILIGGLTLTGLGSGVGALVPRTRPNLAFRVRAARRALLPRRQSSTDTPILARPEHLADNLWFAANGAVYAGYLLCGLPYHLQSLRQRTAVADLHTLLVRELPADSWLYGLAVPQDQRQLLRAMVHGHRDSQAWVSSCAQLSSELAERAPATRVYWLMVPVDAGRAGHSPAGQATRLKDWIAGRDKDSDDSRRAYSELGADIASALPEEFAVMPVTVEMSEWFWRHNISLGARSQPLPTRRQPCGTKRRVDGSTLPVATFDEGDQAHRPARPGIFNVLPSWRKLVRIESADPAVPNSYHAILPVVDAPEGGIVFPGSEFLSALDDLTTGGDFDFAINLTARPRELEFARNDRARGNVDDQYDHRGDVRNGYIELRCTERKLAEYNRLLSANIDEQPLSAAFFIHVGAAEPRILDQSVKRLREELTQSGQIVIRHYRGAQTRLWSVFNPGVAQHHSGTDQFGHATTASKWSRFVPLISTQLGNATGMLLGVNESTAIHSAVLLDLSGTARRNRNPCLVCAGAPGYGKSYAAKRIVRAEIQRGAQAFIVDPDDYGEWAKALADMPHTAVIDMAGDSFGCDPLRIFPARLAGSYWLDYMIPMLGLDPRSTAVAQLRTLLTQESRGERGINTTAALIEHLNNLTAREDAQPEAVVEDLRPVMVALKSWASYDFTQAIFDDTLPVPDLDRLDVTIWQTGSLDLPDAEEMTTPHLYANLSDRQRASVAIYGMLVRLARVTFFNNQYRFGLIVLEEAGALLNSRTGARDAHLISRRARKHYTGMLLITQNPLRDLALMGAEFITQQLVVPFEDEELARSVATKLGLPLDDYPEFTEYFLAQPPTRQLRDPTAFDSGVNDDGQMGDIERGELGGRAFLVDEFRRRGPIRVISEPDRWLHRAYDTTPAQGIA